MPFLPGHKQSKGRPKGSINKATIPLREKAQELNIDPFEILLHFAKGDWKKLGYKEETYLKHSAGGIVNEELYIDPAVRARAAAEACQYLYPKLKVIEQTKKNIRELPTEEQALQFEQAALAVRNNSGS